MATRIDPKRINLGLQGGGSHGALAWGVIDRLLEDERIRIAEVSGTSAGAMNAVILADGLERGGRDGARAALRRYWRAISDAARFSPMQRSAYDRLFGNYSLDFSPGYMAMESLSRIFSPYDLNPFGMNPLRDLVAAQVDFGAVNASKQIRVHVTATNVRTGMARTFATGELSADVIMASACLPQLYQAVEINGEFYWDGGFAANPALLPLVESETVPDVLIVQLNPVRRHEVPRTARDIFNRVNEISFNTSLIKELRTLGLMQRLSALGQIELAPRYRVFIHMIHGEEDVQDLAASSKLNAEWDYLEMLFSRGRVWADQFLNQHFDDLGARSSFVLEDMFNDGELPPAIKPIDPTSRRRRRSIRR